MHPSASLMYPLARYELSLFPTAISPSFRLPSFSAYLAFIQSLSAATTTHNKSVRLSFRFHLL